MKKWLTLKTSGRKDVPSDAMIRQPQAGDPSVADRRRGADETPPMRTWTIVYAVNLVVPLHFGLMSTEEIGRTGMILGIILLFSLGCCLTLTSRGAARVLISGGWIVAASQLMPFLQIIAGLMGLGVAVDMNQGTFLGLPDLTSEFGGFIATMVTGLILLAIAGVLGLVIQGIQSWRSRGTSARVSAGC